MYRMRFLQDLFWYGLAGCLTAMQQLLRRSVQGLERCGAGEEEKTCCKYSSEVSNLTTQPGCLHYLQYHFCEPLSVISSKSVSGNKKAP